MFAKVGYDIVNLIDENATKVTHVVNEGEMIVTQPNVAHNGFHRDNF